MINQPNRRSLEPLTPAIPYPTMEQRDGHHIMHNGFGTEGIGNKILQVLLTSQDNSQILSNLAKIIGDLLGVDTCIVVSVEGNSSNPNQISYWHRGTKTADRASKLEAWLRDLVFNPEDSPNLTLIKSDSSQLFLTLTEIIQEVYPHQTWLGITSKFQHKINGLVLLLKSHSSEWTSSEQELLTQISDSMAIAISQIQLKQQAQTKARYQSLLKNLSREISYSSHPQQLFDKCLTEIGQALQLDRGMILSLKYQNPLEAKTKGKKTIKGKVKVASCWTAKTNKIAVEEGIYFDFPNSVLCQQAWQNAPQYLTFNSDRTFPDLSLNQIPEAIPRGGSALLIMPLMGKKSHESHPALVLGFLVLQYDQSHYWSEEELDLMEWVSVQISTAIMHHQTLTQVQSIVEERTAQLKWSLEVQAKLSEKMRQHIDQLQQLNQLKDDFMNSMSHELKTPLTSMKMAIKMLRQAQISPEMRERYLNILEQEWHREYNLIKDLLTLQQVESGELSYSPQELDLQHTINHLAQSFTAKWHLDKGINLDIEIIDPNLKINTDAESLTHILSELLHNAGKYSNAHTAIKLTATSQTTFKGKNIMIAIANYGEGITPEELPYIFDKFRRGKGVTDRAVPGTGLGLTLVQYLVEHLNGTIDVTSEPTESNSNVFVTTFVLKLPQFKPIIS